MSEISSLHGRCVLVAEDEYLLAEDLRERFEEAGATVLGPVPSLGEALALIEAEAKIDGAVLDLNLAGEMVFPAADALSKRGVPFVFTTGYDERTMPERYGHVTRCEKPFEPADLVRAHSGDGCVVAPDRDDSNDLKFDARDRSSLRPRIGH